MYIYWHYFPPGNFFLLLRILLLSPPLISIYLCMFNLRAVTLDQLVQELVDQGLSITTSFIKSQEPESGYGGDWAIRIQAAEQSRPSEDGYVQATYIYVQPVNSEFKSSYCCGCMPTRLISLRAVWGGQRCSFGFAFKVQCPSDRYEVSAHKV